MKDSSIPDKWKEFSKKSNFFEQLSLEDLTEIYSFETFSIQNNYGWWRLLQGKESEEVLKKKWSIKRTTNSSGIAVEGEPLLSVHTHWKTDDLATKYFNKFIKDKEYCLVHCQGSPGPYDLNIKTDLPIYYVESGLTDTILDWADVIKNAKEIHCIDSSIIHLADSLDLTTEKLYYHDVGRGSQFHLINGWKRV